MSKARSWVSVLAISVFIGSLTSSSPAIASTPTAPKAATCASSVGPGIPPPKQVPSGIDGFHALWYGQSGYMSLCPGTRAIATVAYINVGSRGWVRGRETALLGTSDSGLGQDFSSKLGGDGTFGTRNTGWPSFNRVAVQPADYVGPGQVAWFQFTVQAPARAGVYRLGLRPLIEGITWMEDYGVFWTVTVLNPDGSAPLVTSPVTLADRVTLSLLKIVSPQSNGFTVAWSAVFLISNGSNSDFSIRTDFRGFTAIDNTGQTYGWTGWLAQSGPKNETVRPGEVVKIEALFDRPLRPEAWSILLRIAAFSGVQNISIGHQLTVLADDVTLSFPEVRVGASNGFVTTWSAILRVRNASDEVFHLRTDLRGFKAVDDRGGEYQWTGWLSQSGPVSKEIAPGDSGEIEALFDKPLDPLARSVTVRVATLSGQTALVLSAPIR